MKKISRRDLLKALAAAAGGLSLHQLLRQTDLKALAQDQSIYLPIILKGETVSPTPTPIPEPTVAPPTGNSRVVHLYSQNATSWDFGSSWYGAPENVDQNVVNAMVNTGLKGLTGASTVPAAWQALIPNYQAGQVIAIKVNFNNNDLNTPNNCDGTSNIIDSVPQPILSIVAGLVGIGVRSQDIWIYDAMRVIPDRFKSGITATYPNVQFHDRSEKSCGNLYADFSLDDTAAIKFSQGMTTQYVTNVIVKASHLINVPIMKHHWIGGVSLGFKHHFGTIHDPGALHTRIDIDGGSPYSSAQNPLVDIYKNTHIRNKTRLVIGDGLFGCLGGENQTPTRWSTFGDQAPNSLFFATDPVAIDCVMYDFLHAEIPVLAGGDDYLKLAQTAGLGVYERSSSHQYSQIDYLRVNL